MPYYRISLKAARGICKPVTGAMVERNARATLVFRALKADAARWRRFRKGYLFTSIVVIHAA
jgi:hypothetical protein